ncbi:MAG: methyltransferase domain-containing protein [Firmicutes bacterium]|nr:methyltransferase domain-containing protein [Bacillota bacterium]
MDYMGNKEYWDKKFIQRSDKPLSPETALIDNIKYFKEGSVLDLACGDGRNTLFFLKRGFNVTAVDFSNEALKRLQRFVKKLNYSVDTRQINLSVDKALKDIKIFDNIVINHYRLSKNNLLDIKNHLSFSGILFVSGFGHKHKTCGKIRKEDLIKPTDFDVFNDSFELIDYIENEDDRGFFVTYIFRKK